MLATTVLGSKNCCQVPVFIGRRNSETEGRINLHVMSGRTKPDANYKDERSTKHEFPEEVSHLPAGIPKAPSPPAVLWEQVSMNKDQLGKASEPAQPETTVHTREEEN